MKKQPEMLSGLLEMTEILITELNLSAEAVLSIF